MSEKYWLLYGSIGAAAALLIRIFGPQLADSMSAEVLHGMFLVSCFSAAFGFLVAGHDYLKRKKIEAEVAERAITPIEPTSTDSRLNSTH